MKATLSRFNAGDFRQRHQNTYGFIKVNDKRMLVHVDEVNGSFVSFSDIDGYKFTSNAGSDFEFEFIPVERAWHNTEHNPIYSSRVPARQWQRGVCDGNTRLLAVSDKGRVDSVACDFKQIASIFTFPGLTPLQINKRFEEGKAVALSKAFAVSQLGAVYLYDRAIGTLNLKERKLKLNMPIVMQELSDAFRDSGIANISME